jgi:hypothetical protein
MHLLITSIELLSNQKSLRVGMDTINNLWILMHFKELKIKNKKICYQRYNGRHNNNTHPKRWLKKPFETTAGLLNYLYGKQYDIHHLDIEFTNGWRIKEHPHHEFLMYTTSIEERNTLLNKLVFISGFDPVDIAGLKQNVPYYFKDGGGFLAVDNDPWPDEFWSKEDVASWKQVYVERERKEYLKAHPEEAQENLGEPFTVTTDIQVEGLKLKGWTEGCPF